MIVPTLRVGMPLGTLRVRQPRAQVTQSVTAAFPRGSVGMIFKMQRHKKCPTSAGRAFFVSWKNSGLTGWRRRRRSSRATAAGVGADTELAVEAVAAAGLAAAGFFATAGFLAAGFAAGLAAAGLAAAFAAAGLAAGFATALAAGLAAALAATGFAAGLATGLAAAVFAAGLAADFAAALAGAFTAGLAAALTKGLAAAFAAGLAAAVLAAGLATGFAAVAFTGVAFAPVSFSICLVRVSTLLCSVFSSALLGTPSREIALLRRLSKVSSNLLQVSEMLDLAEPALALAASTFLPTVLLVNFSAFSPSLTSVSKYLPPSLLTFEYTPKPASQIFREYFSTSPTHELLSF
ncbi:hypothetical protein C4J88_5045 [Pseudomonas sp. R4-39-08]|nr:hypothetical protein C4J88_5045 [Pseudomonas sp. R4-39-08]